LCHCARRCATSGRSRSLATTVFFEAQLLGVDEVPDRPIIDLEAALGEFGDKPAQGEVPGLGALQQPGTVLARNCLRLCPPICPGATLPVSRKRRTQTIAVLTPTPNCAAAWWQDRPPLSTAATTRSRRSIEYGLPIHTGLHPSQHVESEQS